MNLSDIQVELSHPLKKFAGWTIDDSADDYDDKWGESFIQKRWPSLKSRMSHLKESFSNWRIIIISKYGTQMLLIKTNQLNNSESLRESVSCSLTKIETLQITTPTVDSISDLNITINF